MRSICYCILLWCIALCACVSCSDKEKIIPLFAITTSDGEALNHSSITFTSKGGSATVNITSNSRWQIECEAEWVDISPRDGQGNGSVVVTVDATTAARSAVAVAYLSDYKQLSQTFNIIQHASSNAEDEPDNGEDTPSDNPDDDGGEDNGDDQPTDNPNDEGEENGEDNPSDDPNNNNGEDNEDQPTDNPNDEGDENGEGNPAEDPNDKPSDNPNDDNQSAEDESGENDNNEESDKEGDDNSSANNPENNPDNETPNEPGDSTDNGSGNSPENNPDDNTPNTGNDKPSDDDSDLDDKQDGAEESASTYTLITTTANLTAGTYYLGGYQGSTLHLASNGEGDRSGHYYTAPYSYDSFSGTLTPQQSEQAIKVILEAASGSNCYYIRFDGEGYLSATAATAGKLIFTQEPTRAWRFTTGYDGFEVIQDDSLYVKLVISKRAADRLLRSIDGYEEGNPIVLLRKN